MKKTKENEVELQILDFGIRFGDQYEFGDDTNLQTFIQGGSQILGNWVDDLYNPQVPSADLIEPAGKIQVANEDYRSFYGKVTNQANVGEIASIPWNFYIYSEARFIKDAKVIKKLFLKF